MNQEGLEPGLRLIWQRSYTVRALGPVVLMILLAANCFASPAVIHSTLIPEPGLLALLGGGLVGLATLVRRRWSK